MKNIMLMMKDIETDILKGPETAEAIMMTISHIIYSISWDREVVTN